MDVSIIIATFGSDQWFKLGNDTLRACREQFNTPTIRVHASHGSLSKVRNVGATAADTEWLCFLDAVDILADDYFDKMGLATGDLLAPRLGFFNSGESPWEPFDLTTRNMDHENPCVIGTLIRKEMFDRVGGFWDEPAYEDWSLFRRAWLTGAIIEHVNTFYYASAVNDSRNNTVENPGQLISDIRVSHEFWRMGI